MNIQDWCPSGWTGLISLFSRVFSNTTIKKHQFFGTQLHGLYSARLLCPWKIFQANILEWVAISFSRGSDSGIKPASPALVGGFFITEPPGKSTLDRYLVVKLLGYIITLSLTSWETAKLFPKWLCHFSCSVVGINVLISPHSHLLLFVLCLSSELPLLCFSFAFF